MNSQRTFKFFVLLAAPPFGKGVGCEALSIITDSQDFPNFGRSKTNSMKSEVHSTALCKRITNCNLVAMSYQHQTRTQKAAVNSSRTQLLWKQSLARSGGEMLLARHLYKNQ